MNNEITQWQLRVNGQDGIDAEDAMRAEIAELRARIESLAADAGRYQLLRKGVLMGYPSPEGCENKDAYLVVTGYGRKESDAIVDEAVDEAIAKEKA